MGGDRGQEPSTEVDVVAITWLIILIMCLGCCGLIAVARHMNPHPHPSDLPTPTISTTDGGIEV